MVMAIRQWVSVDFILGCSRIFLAEGLLGLRGWKKVAQNAGLPQDWVDKINDQIEKWEGITTKALIKTLFFTPTCSVSKLTTVSSDIRLVLPSPLLGYVDKEVTH